MNMMKSVIVQCLIAAGVVMMTAPDSLFAQQSQPPDTATTLGKLQQAFRGRSRAVTTSADVITVNVKPVQYPAKARNSFTVTMLLDIDKGWHVNAHKPSFKYLIGTSFRLASGQAFTVSDIRYPKSEMISFEFSPKPLAVYEGKRPIRLTLKTADTIAAGRYIIKGKLRVQACNNTMCLAPSTLDVGIPVSITDGINPEQRKK